MNIGLYFGTFDPIHFGHINIANFLVNNDLVEKVWFVVTPQNPVKSSNNLIDFMHRYEMVKIQVKDNNNLLASDIELNLKRPNYTINSLRYISKTYPNNSFSLIIGEDNFVNFKKWREYKEIMSYYKIYVYPRKTRLKTDMKLIMSNNIEMIKAPLIDLTSTNIRNSINDKDCAKQFISDSVYKYITTNNLYKSNKL
ncbi:MAG: nicotinate (nicotinamide) nucleotide adenylyltransferase [Bacteroidota bacterium]|nr:nicotinate (nicotinamide) nucleotide adenylyltransferase [Bacteroidota bacterium]|tara:strand:- start:3419 stop:4009 length:591 start_codon:yes stop_codon:yes gene_type:complete